MKNRKDNFINAMIVGAIMLGCSCTLCNKKYGSQLLTPNPESVFASAKPGLKPNREFTKSTKDEVSHVK